MICISLNSSRNNTRFGRKEPGCEDRGMRKKETMSWNYRVRETSQRRKEARAVQARGTLLPTSQAGQEGSAVPHHALGRVSVPGEQGHGCRPAHGGHSEGNTSARPRMSLEDLWDL